MLLELLGGCGQESVVDDHDLSWAAIGLLPGEVGFPELRGTILQSTDTQCSLVEANKGKKEKEESGQVDKCSGG